MTSVVLDSSAILAVIQNEPGQEKVLPVLHGALISTVNLAEVATRIARGGAPQAVIEAAIHKLPVQPCDFSYEHVVFAGFMEQQTRAKGLSLGDRICLTLAIHNNVPVMTTDRAWSEIELPIEVQLIR